MSTPKIGFCCKWLEPNRDLLPWQLLEKEVPMNQKKTTVTYMKTLDPKTQYKKMFDMTQANCAVLWRQLTWLSQQPVEMRLFRVTSALVPLYTVPDFSFIFQDPEFKTMLQNGLSGVREFADYHQIRLCTHPGQFTNICSPEERIVQNAIDELEYHAMLARLMGYGDTWHSSGFAINIHANITQDPDLERFRTVVKTKLSKEARNLITLENDEFSCTVDDIVASKIGDDVALVLDIHHHFVASGGEYIKPDDPRVQVFKDSWRGVRPLGHYSVSSEELLKDHSKTTLPDFSALEEQGLTKTALRAHSHLMWNEAANKWAVSHLSWTDLEVESGGKNLSSKQLYDQYKGQGKNHELSINNIIR